ncbi:MAG: VOC family protein [Actinomycetota bacterium]
MKLSELIRPTTRRVESPVGDDGRPVFAIGHVPVPAADVARLADFYESIGCRRVARLPGIAILELRGGTHLAVANGPSGETTLDLMVDDVDATRDHLVSLGIDVGPIRRQFPHRVFTASDPEGNTLLVHSSHVAGIV